MSQFHTKNMHTEVNKKMDPNRAIGPTSPNTMHVEVKRKMDLNRAIGPNFTQDR